MDERRNGESFAMRYEQQYLRAGGAFYARGYSPLLNMYGSAHNVFAQTFAGKGAVGLIALVLVVLTSLAAAVRTLRRPDAPPRTRVVAMIALGMVAAFAIYGQVQEVFYVPTLQLTVFAACGLAAALEPPRVGRSRAPPPGDRRRAARGGLSAHLVHGHVVPGRLADAYRDREISSPASACPPVLGDDGRYFQPDRARAVITVPRQATELSFDLQQAATAPRDLECASTAARSIASGSRTARGAMVYPLRRLKTLPRRLEIVVMPVGDGSANDRGVAVRQRIRWEPALSARGLGRPSAGPAEQLGVERLSCAAHHRPGERLFDRGAVPLRRSASASAGASSDRRAPREGRASPGSTSQPVSPGRTLSGRPPARVAHDRLAVRHRFERDERAAFVRRMDEHVGGGVPASSRLGDASGQVDARSARRRRWRRRCEGDTARRRPGPAPARAAGWACPECGQRPPARGSPFSEPADAEQQPRRRPAEPVAQRRGGGGRGRPGAIDGREIDRIGHDVDRAGSTARCVRTGATSA
jgi:hypothetical protein